MFRFPSQLLLMFLALLTACAALLAVACADPIAEAPQRYTQRLGLERAPLASPYAQTPTAAADQLRRVSVFRSRVVFERNWCVEQLGDPENVAKFDSHQTILNWAEPATEEELVWMTAAAQATAVKRSLTLEAMPPVFVISPTSLRIALCPLLLHPDSEEPDPLWHLDRLLGNIDPSWTPSVLTRLRWIAASAWYTPVKENEAGERQGGYIVIRALRPLSARHLGTLFSHEIVRALQDAHFGLANSEREDLSSSDAATAFRWAVEGEAFFSALGPFELYAIDEFAAAGLGVSRRGTPPPVRFDQLFPSRALLGFDVYRLGKAAIGAVHADEGYKGVNRLLSIRPPLTTQMIHSEALATDLQPTEREAICALTPEALSEAPCDGPNSDRLGEAFLRTFLAETTENRPAAVAAAAGWRGDLIRVVESPTEGGLALWQLVFANRSEHDEAASELRNWLIARSGARARAAVNASVIAWDGPTSAIRLIDHAQMLWLIVADHPRFADRVALSALEVPAKPSWWDD